MLLGMKLLCFMVTYMSQARHCIVLSNESKRCRQSNMNLPEQVFGVRDSLVAAGYYGVRGPAVFLR